MVLKLNKDKFKKLQEGQKKLKKHTILIVDDEDANLISLKMSLEKDYNILTAEDGQIALDLIKNHENPEQIHLIISDQRMPGHVLKLMLLLYKIKDKVFISGCTIN